MREYKFRAWDKDNKEMLYQGSNTTYNNSVMDCRIVLDELGFDVLVRLYGKDEYEYRNNCELMQYTGLKDKNGTEIYEGDIIKHHDDILSEVFYNTSHCAYLLRDINGYRNKCVVDRLGAYSSLWIEVIGNIHDNPELLGGAE